MHINDKKSVHVWACFRTFISNVVEEKYNIDSVPVVDSGGFFPDLDLGQDLTFQLIPEKKTDHKLF